MAAELAAMAGHSVTIFDQRRSPGRKFVLAGRGGLNVTHSEPLDAFLSRYGPEAQYLERAIRGFTPSDLRDWAEGLDEPTVVGSSGRVFPQSFRAVPLLRSWLARLAKQGVQFVPEHRWIGWAGEPTEKTFRFLDKGGTEIRVPYDEAVLALGGSSWPRVGSDGSWVEVLRDRGVRVNDLRAANCGVTVGWTSHHIERFAGTPIKNAAVTLHGETARGDLMVTATGLEGGPIYAHARDIRAQLDREATTTLTIDLMADLETADAMRRIAKHAKPKRSISTQLTKSGISPVGISVMREATGNNLPACPEALATLAKSVPVRVDGHSPIERSISCAGGIAWDAVDQNLQLRAHPNTYAVGEMLDWEAPTGGYLLQAVFSTAHLVGTAIAGNTA